MEMHKNPTESDHKSISNMKDQDVAIRFVDNFIKFKERRIAEYKKVADGTPYDNVWFNIEYIMSKENKCLEEAKKLRSAIDKDGLDDIKLRRTENYQIYDHLEGQELEEANTKSITDILKAALAEDKDMIDRLKLISVEYNGTHAEKAAEHLMNSIVDAKNGIT
ncbi:MAG: hypothetical protein QXR73_01305, partial [Candidatus Micrarchaeaceae archaeon]